MRSDAGKRVPIALMPESSAEESALNSGFFRCDKLEMEEGEISVRALCLSFHSASGRSETWAGGGGGRSALVGDRKKEGSAGNLR